MHPIAILWMVFVLVFFRPLRGYALSFQQHEIHLPYYGPSDLYTSIRVEREREKKTSFSISTKAMPQARCFSGPLGIELGFGLLLQQH